jgi:hypothetical protein
MVSVSDIFKRLKAFAIQDVIALYCFQLKVFNTEILR